MVELNTMKLWGFLRSSCPKPDKGGFLDSMDVMEEVKLEISQLYNSYKPNATVSKQPHNDCTSHATDSSHSSIISDCTTKTVTNPKTPHIKTPDSTDE